MRGWPLANKNHKPEKSKKEDSRVVCKINAWCSLKEKGHRQAVHSIESLHRRNISSNTYFNAVQLNSIVSTFIPSLRLVGETSLLTSILVLLTWVVLHPSISSVYKYLRKQIYFSSSNLQIYLQYISGKTNTIRYLYYIGNTTESQSINIKTLYP